MSASLFQTLALKMRLAIELMFSALPASGSIESSILVRVLARVGVIEEVIKGIIINRSSLNF